MTAMRHLLLAVVLAGCATAPTRRPSSDLPVVAAIGDSLLRVRPAAGGIVDVRPSRADSTVDLVLRGDEAAPRAVVRMQAGVARRLADDAFTLARRPVADEEAAGSRLLELDRADGELALVLTRRWRGTGRVRADSVVLEGGAGGSIVRLALAMSEASALAEALHAASATAGGASPVERTYYGWEVAHAAEATGTGCALRFPERLRARGIRGSVIAVVEISATGRIAADGLHVLHATDPEFARAVREAARCMYYRPARLASGQAVRTIVSQVFDFDIADRPVRESVERMR